MSVGRQRTGHRDSGYERPGSRWVCGHLAAGRPCPVGPDRRGRCTASQQSLCTPRREGKRWFCTRPAPFGGACADGPLPDGRCARPEPEHRPCRPRLSLRARRGRLSAALAVLALGLALVLLDGRMHLRWISPGNLSSPHTAIAGSTATQCGACHSAPDGHPHRWLRLSFAAPAAADSGRCLDCHFGGLDPGQARLDHSVPPAALAGFDATPVADVRHRLAAVWGPPEREPAGLACARCHQEHRGRDADIAALDDLRCQACHAARIAAFAQDHPALTAPVKPPSLAFDHVQHRPFWPDQQLPCGACHALAADGRTMTTGGYSTCAGCHAQGQDDYHGYAIKRRPHTVLQPPDMEAGPEALWPGGSGVTLSPAMWLLLAGDDDALAALEDLYSSDDLGIESEPFEWYPDDEGLRDEFARAFRRLLDDLADADAEALTARLAVMAGGDAPVGALVEQLLAGQLALAAYRAHWDRDDSDLDQAPAPARAATGWRIDPVEAAVGYRPSGHADPLPRAWIEYLASAPAAEEGFRARLWDDLRTALLEPGGWLHQTCVGCHRQAALPATQTRWMGLDARTPDSGYFKFTHRSHFDIRRGSENCAGCHALGEEGGPNRGFAPYARDRCGDCHRPGLAPDDCLHCHNYHFVRP